MNDNFKTLVEELTAAIQSSYEQGVTMEEAEKLAAKFLYGQIQVAEKLQVANLDSRMKKTGVKAIRAGVYMAEATRSDKKPSDVLLGALVDQAEAVITAQDLFDKAEVENDMLENYFNIFREGHIYFRGVSRGRFE